MALVQTLQTLALGPRVIEPLTQIALPAPGGLGMDEGY